MRGDISLDTNVAIGILNGEREILRAIAGWTTCCLPLPVVGELRYGAYRSAKCSENLVKIDALEMRCAVLESDSEVADMYGVVRSKLVKAGKPIPENDVWIAAICLRHGLPLMTRDVHFRAVAGLHTIAA